MSFSAFKSTSKRGTTPTSSSSSSKQDTIPNRRSKSVTPLSKTNGSVPKSSNLSVSDEYLNKRDNPLYCWSSSSSSSSSSPPGAETHRRRGRSVSRSSGTESQNLGNEKPARSLSRVGNRGRRRIRSVSRERNGSSETDIEHQYKSASSLSSKDDSKSVTSKGQKKSAVTADKIGSKEQTKNLQTWSSQHPISKSCDTSSSRFQARNWEDGISTTSFSKAEEATTSVRDNLSVDVGSDAIYEVGSDAIYETVRSEVRRAVSKIRDDLENALWRKDLAIHSTENIVDIPPEFLSYDELVSVSDPRMEYVSKLEQTQERTRKLRADLAVEEHREQELSRILKEIIHAPTNSDLQKSRPKRRASMERIRMSRRLAEEAMNYFDECVSISTFDSSDFSSLEDPHPSSAVGIPSMGSSRFFPNEGLSYSVTDFSNVHGNHHEELDNQTHCSLSIARSDLSHANVSHDDQLDYDTPRSVNSQLSFSHDRTESVGVHDIRQYIKKFDKGPMRKNFENVNIKSSYNRDEYDLSVKAESLVFDSVILGNRIESGGLLLCDIRCFS